LNKEDITRYIRPEDIPLMDRAILEPIVSSMAREMSETHPAHSVEEWVDILQKALLRGDILIVIDDKRKRLGIVHTDEPPFSALVNGEGSAGIASVDPLDLKQWERGDS